MKKPLKILITGPIFPPAGGISIHIHRLIPILKDEFDIDLIDESPVKKAGVFNIRSLNVFRYLKKVSAADILFIHSGNRLFKKIHILTGCIFAKKIIITIHGYGPKRRQPFRTIDNFVFDLSHKIIIVNPHIAERLHLAIDKCIVQHAFLPPDMADEPALPVTVAEWLRRAKENNSIIICANASKLDLFNNEDLYGLDMCIEVARRLKEKRLSVSFVFIVSAADPSTGSFAKNFKLIADLGLQEYFMLVNERLSFVRLIENADIVLRPTNKDGDALTVREAIFLGKTALASDVVERPEGTVLFKTRDMKDLEIKLEALVRNANAKSDHLKTVSYNNEDFKKFYVNLINTVALN